MADLLEAAELLDVDVDELPGMLALIAPHWFSRICSRPLGVRTAFL
jgi:hypothetical protein